VLGQTGLINMPDGRIEEDGTWRFGESFLRPYVTTYSSLSFLPRIELSARYTGILGVQGFPNSGTYGSGYGIYKDKSAGGKFLLSREDELFPSLAIGLTDVEGTGLFKSEFAAASKRIGDFDFTVGYGRERIDGAFGGLRYSPEWGHGFSLVAEYDATNYARDPFSNITGVDQRKKEPAAGIEYKWQWFGVQATYGHNEVGVQGNVSIPLQQKEFVAKTEEPEPYVKILPRPTLAQWEADPGYRKRMAKALFDDDFRSIRLTVDGYRVDAVLTNTRISQVSRAVGRAARVILQLAPLEVREIRITYTINDLPFVTYTITDVRTLQRYYNGQVGRQALADYVEIRYAAPQPVEPGTDRDEMLAAFEEKTRVYTLGEGEGDLFALIDETGTSNKFKIGPKFSGYFNDPSGAFKYDLYMLATYDRYLAEKTYLSTAVRATVMEDVSQVTQPSNSTLPHVRTDVADYDRQRGVKLDKLVVNRFYQPAEGIYARTSAGIYEQMFGGGGGQLLYLPSQESSWAVDWSADWVKQRDFEGWFGFRDYDVLTSLVSMHYRLAYGMTAAVRAGRFLAGDEGARFELKRRFDSGVEIGLWYTLTNGNDITSPGTPQKPYHDKGVFVYIPIAPLLSHDTQAFGSFSIEPWTRDVGQMVVSPADLYDMVDRPINNVFDKDGLDRFGDYEDEYPMPSEAPAFEQRMRWAAFRAQLSNMGPSLFDADWMPAALIAGGALAAGAALDKPVDRLVKNHQGRASKAMGDVGTAVALGAVGISGMLSFDDAHPRLGNTGFTAAESAGVALAASYALKYAVGRARPDENLGAGNFHPRRPLSESSFPSDLATVTWAALTPYAKEYDMPWLYGVAALSNLGRIAQRRHWVSDTVAGSILGYAIGSFLWDVNRRVQDEGPIVSVTPTSVAVTWPIK